MRILTVISLAALIAATPLAAQAPDADNASAFGFETSDIAPESEWRFGRLENGLRYAIRHNERPEGTALVRMQIETGSLDESDAERGYAHFIEHMAFNGSANVPEGEMVKLLEREGLAFGADTNAFTTFDRTQYKLDLPRADPALLDTALMLMRETAGNLSFTPDAVDRERGVVLSELRDGNTYQRDNFLDNAAFLYPDALYRARLPIGVPETLDAATADRLKAFYAREYTPADTWLVVVGDFDPALVETAIARHFADWRAAAPTPRQDEGTVDAALAGQTDVFLDPALSEEVTVVRHGAWLDEPDSVAARQTNLLRQIGYAAINRRLARLARLEDPPFKAAGMGTGDVFEIGRTTRLVVRTLEGAWRPGLDAATTEYERAMRYGFGEAEIAEQVARIRTALENGAKGEGTRSNAALVNDAFGLIDRRKVPADPAEMVARFEAFAPDITPEAVLAALREEALPLEDPLIRFEGRMAPKGGADALRAAWDVAAAREVAPPDVSESSRFAYTDFGPAGQVASDVVEPVLGIREVRFANNVRLNLKRTDIQDDRVSVSLAIDGGSMLATRDDPLAVVLSQQIPAGGLGAHSADELQTILAGRSVQNAFGYGTDYFGATVHTVPSDLELQLELLAATITDPGYRPEGERQYHRVIDDYFARLTATPAGALTAVREKVLSDEDPRFTLAPPQAYKTLTFGELRDDIADRLAHGAIEIGIVGDVDEDEAIALVARTFGALPVREPDFAAHDDNRQRTFTATRERVLTYHTGKADQALLQYVWPTRDYSDPIEAAKLTLLDRVMDIELTEGIRERLGKSYSPSSSMRLSREYPGYGTFSITASVDLADVDETEHAISAIVEQLRTKPVDADTLERARRPMLEGYDNALKSNAGWMRLVDRAQSRADDIARFATGKERLLGLTAGDVQAMAQRYLAPDQAVEFAVLPEVSRPNEAD